MKALHGTVSDEETRHLLDRAWPPTLLASMRWMQNIGRLVTFLKAQNVYENTAIFFMSDNGACQEGGILGSGSEQAARDLFRARARQAPAVGRLGPMHHAPFRYYKHFVHEGGMSTPMMAHWPAGIPGSDGENGCERWAIYQTSCRPFSIWRKGSISAAPGESLHPHAGQSLLPLLRGEKGPVHQSPIFWEHEGNRARARGKVERCLGPQGAPRTL